ncbi:MAG: tetratricopeptide repeat protein [Candidatus Neomarinimicrobiota bacterium]
MEELRHHRFHLALALADSAEEYAINGADAHFFRGRIYSELGRFGKADTSYRTALKLRPDYRGVWNNLGNNAFRQQKYRQAIEYYRNELHARPAQIPLRGMGRAYVELGKVDSARLAFQQALQLDDEYAPAYLSLAFLEEDEGDFEKAVQHAEKAFDLDSENLEYRYMYASLLLRTGQSEEAVDHLRYVTEKWPWHHGSHYNLAQALIQLSREEEAIEYLEEAEQVRATQAKIDHLENTVHSLPNDPLSHAALAFALRRVGRYNDAMHAYKVALYLDPLNPEIRNNVANLYLMRGDTTEGLNQYKIVLEQDSTLVDIWINLGIICALSNEKEMAQQAWQNALKYDPDNPMAQAYLSKLSGTPSGGPK